MTPPQPAPVAAALRSRAVAQLVVVMLCVVALVSYFPHLELFVYGAIRDELLPLLIDRDFANYWLAGHMTLAGDAHSLFDPQAYLARLQSSFGPGLSAHNWGYPPHFLLVLWPLGFLHYKSALFAFLAVSFALFVVAALLFRRVYAPDSNRLMLGAAMLGYSLVQIDATQNGFLLGAAMLAGLAWMRRAPAAAGFAFALLTVKPQLALILPLLLLFERNWRVIAWTAAFTVLLVGVSAALFGVDTWMGYLTQSLAYQHNAVMTEWGGIFLRMMPTVFAGLRAVGWSSQQAYLVQWPVSIATLALAAWVLWKEKDPLRRIFCMLCATLLVTPYAFNYDLGALAVAAAVLAGSQSFASRAALVAVAIVAGLAGLVMNLGRANMPVAPLLLAASLIAIALETRRSLPAGDQQQVLAEPAASHVVEDAAQRKDRAVV